MQSSGQGQETGGSKGLATLQALYLWEWVGGCCHSLLGTSGGPVAVPRAQLHLP